MHNSQFYYLVGVRDKLVVVVLRGGGHPLPLLLHHLSRHCLLGLLYKMIDIMNIELCEPKVPLFIRPNVSARLKRDHQL